MKRFPLVSAALAVPAFALLVAVGCGGGGTGTDKPKTEVAASKKEKPRSSSSSGAKEELASTGWGTLKGKVTFDGTPPTPAKLPMEKDHDHCIKGPASDTTDPKWRVGADKGVANVIVWLQAPKNKYFKIPDDRKSEAAPVVIQQPFCAFEPHVFVLYPSYYDAKSKAQKSTGQKLKITNPAPIAHNTNVSFGDPILNSGGLNKQLPPAKGGNVEAIEIADIKPCKDKDCSPANPQDVTVKCDIHQWMYARGKIFDHPYEAVTSGDHKGDKAFGDYEIKQVPTGVEVEIMYWHESMDKPALLKKVTLKSGDNVENFKIK